MLIFTEGVTKLAKSVPNMKYKRDIFTKIFAGHQILAVFRETLHFREKKSCTFSRKWNYLDDIVAMKTGQV
jgi:hypothetical protein